MYVIGIIETQFFAYLQLIRYRLCLLNKLLLHCGKNVNFTKGTSIKQIATLDEATQIKTNLFEYLPNDSRTVRLNDMLKYPTVNYMR